jgi:hypothetical protein
MRLPGAIKKLQLVLDGEWLLRSPSQLRCVDQSGVMPSVWYARDRGRPTTDRSIGSTYCRAETPLSRDARPPGNRPGENLRSSTFRSKRVINSATGIHRTANRAAVAAVGRRATRRAPRRDPGRTAPLPNPAGLAGSRRRRQLRSAGRRRRGPDAGRAADPPRTAPDPGPCAPGRVSTPPRPVARALFVPRALPAPGGRYGRTSRPHQPRLSVVHTGIDSSNRNGCPTVAGSGIRTPRSARRFPMIAGDHRAIGPDQADFAGSGRGRPLGGIDEKGYRPVYGRVREPFAPVVRDRTTPVTPRDLSGGSDARVRTLSGGRPAALPHPGDATRPLADAAAPPRPVHPGDTRMSEAISSHVELRSPA